MRDRNSGGRVAHARPPVTETSLGVQFVPLPGWDVNIFGLFAQRIRDHYPSFASAPPASLEVQGSIFLSGVPKIRGLYTSESQNNVVQIQDDFFFVNWRKQPHSSSYPGYDVVRANFVDQWRTFNEFLAGLGIATPMVRRYQVTYVNHTEAGELSPGDLLTNWAAPAGSDQLGFSLSTTYRLVAMNVDVTIAMQPAVRTIDNVGVTQTTITTSRTLALPSADADPAIKLDEMHDALIKTFQSITSEAAKIYWSQE